MSGHSKWANIKHKKGAADARRGKVFTKLIKEITVAARAGSGDSAANPRLRAAIAAAKQENMPKDNIERAIKKGTGDLEGVSYDETTYEGYGPGGAAVLIDSLTDNKNRAVSEIRHALTKHGGNMGESGCVAWMFKKKGYMVIERSAIEEDALMEVALEAGAEDVRAEDDAYEVITEPDDFEAVKAAIDAKGLACEVAEVTMLPQTMAPVEGENASRMIRLIEYLDDLDDVQKVYTNADLPDDVIDE
ncbi:MAG: YebC/PmpR family DNA-binding transcriptional regulator [Desulfatitalea sp.]|nr:YebC/PmpR family DNA-binding transcriptional regulator [Desulfatitalea sp.]